MCYPQRAHRQETHWNVKLRDWAGRSQPREKTGCNEDPKEDRSRMLWVFREKWFCLWGVVTEGNNLGKLSCRREVSVTLEVWVSTVMRSQQGGKCRHYGINSKWKKSRRRKAWLLSGAGFQGRLGVLRNHVLWDHVKCLQIPTLTLRK